MRLLLDTNVVIWWLLDQVRLSSAVRDAIADSSNEVFVSAATAWEIATKHRIGKLAISEEAVLGLPDDLENIGIRFLEITFQQALLAGRLLIPHRDPFDRMIIAQAKAGWLAVATNDRAFADLGLEIVW